MLHLDEEQTQDLKDEFCSSGRTAWVRCTHFVKLDYVPNRTELLALFTRGAAAITKNLQPGVDLIIPIVFCEDHDTKITADMVS
jgi:hypothetical protein